ncbi:MAG TPA: hypothetical protein VJR89_40080 [Polyangiales bacterium]|nr:hypothetical protein [Polyangiales bacterium]
MAVTCAAACSSEPDDDLSVEPPAAVSGRGSIDPNADRDHDGVCDGTERELGSDADRADSDHDGLPDFTEIVAGFNLTDPTIPSPDQVGFLAGVPQAALDMRVRMTLEGSGQGYTGEFREMDALEAHGLTARDFFEGAVAQGGEPPDNIRGVVVDSERIGSVLGRTRLAFKLRFRVSTDKLPDCAIGFPFEYRLKADNEKVAASRDYVLVVTPETEDGERAKFCVPSSCL